MAAVYHASGMEDSACFSMFVRDCPGRNFFVAAGLEDALQALESFRFSEKDLTYLESQGLFSDGFLSRLERFRFSGAVRALPEGSLFFPEEPIMEVVAPILEAQIFETYLLNTVGFQTLIASKAARCVHAAAGRGLVDFSLRRTQAADAGMKVARSVYIAGFDATSNVQAGKTYGIPISGTMAHSFVQAFEDEATAFAAYAEIFPENSVFLIDTYDTLLGAEIAAQVGRRMKREGRRLAGVRLDSGDMAQLSREVRNILDAAGLPDVKIYASGGFDEWKVARSIAAGARIDAFGVGTALGVSADAPYLDIVYKLVRYGDRPVRKYSSGKATLAGEKQVFRSTDAEGRWREDIIGMRREERKGARPLLASVMEDGTRREDRHSLSEIRERFREEFIRLPNRYKAIDRRVVYPVRISEELARLQQIPS
jgi:nicotinate phosphoribosyltransferase